MHDERSRAADAAVGMIAPDTKQLPARVLIAEDEHLVAVDLARHVKSLAIDVVGPAARGAEAIELARSQRPDMALLDIQMPGGTGLEVAQVLREELEIPVILVSAYSDPEYVRQGARAGVFGYLLKPASADDLRVTIEVAWQRYLDLAAEREQSRKLKQRLEDRKIIEQAKWLLVQHKEMAEPDAMRALQRQARNSRKTLVDVAQSVLDGGTLLLNQ